VNYLVDTSGSLSQVVAESNAAGQVTAYYVRGDDLLSVARASGTRFYHADGLGSIRRLTDEAGNITDGYTYTAFGELLSHTGSDQQPYAFTGEPLDPNSGFQYHRARWMDPRVGRLASMDPLLGTPYDPPTLHRYLYAGQDPVNKADPTGKEETGLTGQLIGVGIQAVISGIALGALEYYKTRDFNRALYAGGKGFIIGAVIGGVFLGVRLYLAARAAAALAEVGGDVVIASDKLRFLTVLDPGKAQGFRLLGYTTENTAELGDMLTGTKALITSETAASEVTQYGTKYVVQAEIVGPNGAKGIVEVVWQVDAGSKIFRLITAIPHPFS
jgi:RHS repeat-associated protein